MKIAQAALSVAAYSFDREYTYRVPHGMSLERGMRVLVPFGRSNRRVVAVVLDLSDRETADDGIKEIISVIDKKPLISDEMLNIMHWLKNTTFCTYFEAFRSMIPSGLSYRVTVHYRLANVEINADELTVDEVYLVDRLKNAKNQKEIDTLLGGSDKASGYSKKETQILVSSLLDKGVLEEVDLFKRGVGDKTERTAGLSEKYLTGGYTDKLTARQSQVVKLLENVGTASFDEICYMTGCTTAVVKRLADKGILQVYNTQIMRKATADAGERKSPDEITLSAVQQAAFDGIMKLVAEGKPSGALLYGVTGSGKTSVFFKLIDAVLKQGKTALMMVPEISLTPQIVRKFKLYFGDEIALLHSSLSMGQRADEFQRIKNGEAKIVVGTRSAVFAPLENIGIIIMDEEGERTYKSDSAPRYHARDVAIMRCGCHSCVLVMASATPSIESFYYAKTGRFHLFEMRERYADAVLPTVEIVDMQSESMTASEIFGDRLIDEIKSAVDKKEQVMLLLNRRGYTTYMSCTECRQPISCPNCSLPLTYHIKNNRLMCHYCGYSMGVPQKCPQCGAESFRQSGVGTQRVEDELQRLFPEIRLLRMDADTTFSRGAYEESFSAFEKGEYDILLGTQMIAKGLNFPNVTLVGVVSIDKALFTGDFRSYERTFSLITQVAGRSGRGVKPGRAIIQTYVPDHYVINLAAEQDYDEFYEQEAALRKALLFPPFCDICAVNFSSLLESKAIAGANRFMDLLKKYISENDVKIPLRVLGIAPCTLGRINNRYRYRIIIKCRVSAAFDEMMSSLLMSFYSDSRMKEIRISADINGDIGL